MSDGLCLIHALGETHDRDNNGEKVVFVQGLITNPYLKRTFEHAWVELPDKDLVSDCANKFSIPRSEFYEIYNPTNIIRIDPIVLATLTNKHKEIKFFTRSEVEQAKEHVAMLDAKYPRKDLKNDRKKKIVKSKSKRKVCRCKK
jgi:hypothetical protein